MTHKVCNLCDNRWIFDGSDICTVCEARNIHYTMIYKCVKNCDVLDEGILSNISEYMIENSYRMTDDEIHQICNSRTLNDSRDLDDVNQLFLQLHHNNEMII